MKKILYLATIGVMSLTACQNLVKSDNGSADSSYDKMELYERDQSITAENAYSDLFVDSSALNAYLRQNNITDGEAQQIQSFYNTRNFGAAWFTSEGMTEQGRGFWNLYDHNNKENEKDSFFKRMDTLSGNDSLRLAANDSTFLQSEMELTRKFLQYARDTRDSNSMMLANYRKVIPAKRLSTQEWAEALTKEEKDQPAANRSYTVMKEHLARYHKIAQSGGWQPAPFVGTKQLKKGVMDPAIAAIKKRLSMTGEFAGNDTSAQYNDALESAIRGYQQRNGFQPTGIINDSLIAVLNVPVEQRLRQIILNLNRTVWTPAQKANMILVNIPEFMLHTYENGRKAFDMEVVVGKEGNNTTMFTGEINEIVFSPYWNIPNSIVENEIKPALKRDPGYLKKNNMEVVEEGRFRQLPGPKNSLGRVKFLFPNSFDIYLHDTPNKGLFNKQDRAFSHGCIRVANAVQLAQYLLRNQKEWTPEKIGAAMNSNKEQRVKVDQTMPVVITYYTAWVDEQGGMHFRNDVYGLDERTAGRLFTDAMGEGGLQNSDMPVGNDSSAVKKDTSRARRL
jgi:murein L,D-transpeptidase YcbB/YkuD